MQIKGKAWLADILAILLTVSGTSLDVLLWEGSKFHGVGLLAGVSLGLTVRWLISGRAW